MGKLIMGKIFKNNKIQKDVRRHPYKLGRLIKPGTEGSQI